MDELGGELDNYGPLTEPWDGKEIYVQPIRDYCRKHGKALSDFFKHLREKRKATSERMQEDEIH